MKLFGKATVKLTAIYTGIIMTISLTFSAGIVAITMGEVRRPYQAPVLFQKMRMTDDFNNAYLSRAEAVETKVWANLTMINVNLLIIGGIVSYLLARWTLRPIERAMEDEARFVSDASHELRTPLATMRMENEVLLRDAEAKEADYRDQLKSNLEEIDKLRAMTDALLKMSSSSEISTKRQDVEPIVDTAIGRASRQAEAKDIAIVKELKPFRAVCNDDALTEILYIYLDNAVKYSPKGSTIRVSNYGNRGLAVSDQGNGIAAKDLPSIFNRFYRADESRNSDGFGLGLSLASRLAERTGAKVAAFNNRRKSNDTQQSQSSGATFTIVLK